MTRILDIEKVQAALDRAADASLHGDREDRNGKYDGGNRTSARKVALRIRDEIRIAIRNWATVEAYNNQGERLQELLEANNAWRPAHSAVKALVRDVIAALMRLTDGPGIARESLCGLVVLLDNKNATELAQATGANRPRHWHIRQHRPEERLHHDLWPALRLEFGTPWRGDRRADTTRDDAGWRTYSAADHDHDR